MAAAILKGTIVPLVTPFGEHECIDAARLQRLVEFILAEGADYLMPTALTGEGPLLDTDETLVVWRETFKAAAGRGGVIPAIISTRTATAVRLAKAAHDLGAPAITVAPIVPELYAGRSESDVIEFHAEVGAATPLPLILFNYPSLTGVDLTPQLVVKLSEIDNVAYIKESTSDSRRVHSIQRLCQDRVTVICGNPNAAFESIALGCGAWITGIMNVAPKSARHMMDAILVRRDLDAAKQIYYHQLLPLVDLIARNNNPTGTIKAGLRARGIDVGVPRRPGRDISQADAEALHQLVRHIKAAEAACEPAA